MGSTPTWGTTKRKKETQMSIWFEIQVSAIGDNDSLAKLLNIEVGHKDTSWSLGTIHFSAGMKNAPPINSNKTSKENPEVIFAISSFCDTGGSYYRYLLLNGKHMPIDTIEDMYSSEIESHYAWADKLRYEETKKMIDEFDQEGALQSEISRPIPINKDTEIGFVENKPKFVAFYKHNIA